MLEQMDLATSRAQGWLRGRGAARRLSAMQTLSAAWPGRKDERVAAQRPMDILKNVQWQRPAPEQVRPATVLACDCLCNRATGLPVSETPALSMRARS
jgi:hypothetical protein